MERMALENVFAMVNVSGESEDQSGEEQASSSSTTSSSSSTITSSASSFPTTSSSVYHTVQSASGSRGSSSPSVYYSAPVSARIQSMIENRSNFSSETDFDIEYSRDHWSELTDSDTDNASTRLANRQHFDKLKEHPEWGGFFKDVKVELGEKINEGGQAEIFDAIVEFEDGRKSPGYGYHVVKVMKGDCPLQDFQRQWPVGMLCNASKDRVKGPLMWIQGGTLVKDRFAFVMLRQWGDLRKLIDTKMQLNNNRGPPFANIEFVKKVMLCIARDMDALHRKYKIVHRDLKASNVLLWSFGEQLPDDNPHVKANVVDYECSVGVVGTGFWRAPEILEQFKNRIPSSEIVFTCMSDVYSYGMMCYELLTGRTPFEGHPSRDYDFVLNGNRPSLSKFERSYDPLLNKIAHSIKRCWSHDPSVRPSFSELIIMLESVDCTKDGLKLQVSIREDKAGIVMKLAEAGRTELVSDFSLEHWIDYIVNDFSRIFPLDEWTKYCLIKSFLVYRTPLDQIMKQHVQLNWSVLDFRQYSSMCRITMCRYRGEVVCRPLQAEESFFTATFHIKMPRVTCLSRIEPFQWRGSFPHSIECLKSQGTTVCSKEYTVIVGPSSPPCYPMGVPESLQVGEWGSSSCSKLSSFWVLTCVTLNIR